MISYRETDQVHYIGTSEEDKPLRADDGADFLESDTRDLYQWDGSDWFFVRNVATLSGGGGGGGSVDGKQVYVFASSSNIGAGGTTYLSPKDTTFNGTELIRQMLLPYSGRIVGLWCWNGGPPSGGDVVIRVRVNGSDTGLTITIVDGTTFNVIVSDVAHPVNIAAGDKVSLRITNNSSGAWSVGHFELAVEWD